MCLLEVTEDLLHAIVRCPGNAGVGQAVLQCLPQVHAEDDSKILKLEIGAEGVDEYPIVWFLAVSWMSIWDSRRMGRRPWLYKVRADLEAKVSLLRETRHSESASQISSMISKLDTVN